MSQTRLKFEAPPVVEMALSVQFGRLPGYTTAHSGWFWKDYVEKLGDDTSKWSQIVEAPRIDDQFEKFGPEDVWIPPLSMKVLPGVQSQRLQIIRADNERMIQVQDSRFILNWRKQKSSYPSYDTLLPEFRTMFQTFEAFVGETRLGPLALNQWEVIYVDQLKKGEMWKSARDWNHIFPGLSMLPVNIPQVPPSDDETMSADWRFSLASKRGRMYISLRQVRLQPSSEEVLNVTFLARGPISDSTTWEQGFEAGHEALSETFLAVTSPAAQERWKRRA